MPNLHKEARNAEIARLFDDGRGLTHRQIAEKFGLNISTVSMVIVRWNNRIKKKGLNPSDSNQ
jgi:transposase